MVVIKIKFRIERFMKNWLNIFHSDPVIGDPFSVLIMNSESNAAA